MPSAPRSMPRRSWDLGGPVIFTASDPSAADGKVGARIPMQIIRPGERPDWTTRRGSAGRIYQAESSIQAAQAIEAIRKDKADGFIGATGVVTNLGIDPKPFIAEGVTSCFVECYGQAGLNPYAIISRMKWQAKQDGWTYVVPTLGVYDNLALSAYVTINGGPTAFAGGHWHGGPLAIYLGEGVTDTDSWELFTELCLL